MRTKITLLGATGSIGSSTLDVIAANPDKYELYAAVCGCNDEKMLDIIKRFAPKRAAIYLAIFWKDLTAFWKLLPTKKEAMS